MNVAVDPGTALAIVFEPSIVLNDKAKFDELFAGIKAEVTGHVPDVSTATGRKFIASLAYKVARTKTTIDEAGKALNVEARAKIGLVDKARRESWDKFEALQTEVREPLTEWEREEAARVQSISDTIEMVTKAGVLAFDDTSATVAARLATIQAVEITEAEFGDMMLGGIAARDSSIAILSAAATRLAQAEAERAQAEADRLELEQLRAAKAKQDEADRLAREAADRAEWERNEAEIRRQEAAEAVENTRIAAEQKAARDAAAAEQRHQAEIARVKKDAADAAQAEADRMTAATKETQRKIAALRAEDERKAANKRHQSAVMRAAKEALMEAAGIDETTAKAIVTAIVAGAIPAISIKF